MRLKMAGALILVLLRTIRAIKLQRCRIVVLTWKRQIKRPLGSVINGCSTLWSISMTFNINAYQHFYLKGPNFQEIWKSQNLKIFTFKKKCHYFCTGVYMCARFNTLRPRPNRRHFADDIFKCIFLNKNVWISINISLKFVPKGPIDHIPSLVQIMAWCRPGDKPLSEPMMISLLTHICVTRPQLFKCICRKKKSKFCYKQLWYTLCLNLAHMRRCSALIDSTQLGCSDDSECWMVRTVMVE